MKHSEPQVPFSSVAIISSGRALRQAVKSSYLMWPEWTDGRISFIRDYRYVRYVFDDAELN